MTNIKRVAIFALSTILGFSIAAQAQDVTGSITGIVSDSSGAAIKGATVTLVNTDRNHTERVLTTNSAGSYTATSLPAGTYTVRESAPGFKQEEVTGLVLHVNDNLTVNRSLQVGSAGDVVTINADALQVSLQDATATGLITGTQARELVLSTRNFEQLLSLQPGVAYTGTSDQIYIGPTAPVGVTTLSFSVNGQRTSANYWTIDGADNMDRGTNLTLLVYPSVDAISEFKTLRGVYSAAFGRTASGQINVVTKSGTNTFHANAYEFFRNDYLNANDWANKNKAPGVAFDKRPPLRYNDFGYTVDGPVWIPKLYNGHDKTFFFFGQEYRRVIRYSQTTLYLPTADERRGVFPTPVCTNIVAASGKCADTGTATITNISPAAAAYLKDIYANVPLPNPGSPTLDPHTYNFNARSVYNDRQEALRIDQAIGHGSNIFYRYIHDTIPTQEPFGFGGTSGLPGVQTTNTRSPGGQHLIHLTYVFSPTTVVNAGFAYSTGAIISNPTGSGSIAGSPDIHIPLPYPSYLGVVPNLTFTTLTGLSQGGGYNDYSDNSNYFADITKTFGHHTLSGGATFNRYEKTENLQGGNVGTFNFSSSTSQLPSPTTAACAVANPPDFCKYLTEYQTFANFLSGTATAGFTQSGQPRIPDLHANSIEVYLQDDWKATPRLTVNFGLRYSYFGAPTDSNGWLANFDANTYNPANAPTVDTAGTLCVTSSPCLSSAFSPNGSYDAANGFVFVNPAKYGVSGHTPAYGNTVAAVDRNNLAPRFGFAFDVFGDGKTALRGGYGIAFDATLFGNYENATFYAQPALGGSTYSFTSFDNPAAGTVKVASTAPAPPTPIYTQATLMHTPYAQQYSLDLQQQITPTLMVDIGYYGAHDTHLLGYTDINSLAPGQAAKAGLLPAGGFVNSTQVTVINQIRKYKGYAGMYSEQPIYNSNYNSLQLQVKKRFKGKSEISGNFSWQRNLSNGPIGDRSSAPQNVYNIKAEYGRVAYDRNTFGSIDFIWDLPWLHEQKGLAGRVLGGWEVSGIIALDSGLPSTVTASQGLKTYYPGSNGSGVTPAGGATYADVAGLAISGSSPASLRPDQIGNPMGNYSRSRYKWFNTAAFANPSAAVGAPGNEKRGTITLPGFNREDVGIFRNFRIYRSAVFQLRGEAFNVFNHTSYNTVQTAATSTNFGQVTGAREARILQIAGKISF